MLTLRVPDVKKRTTIYKLFIGLKLVLQSTNSERIYDDMTNSTTHTFPTTA